MNSTLIEVTERIRERSAKLRGDYLARIAQLNNRQRGFERMGCANVAHAVAAMPSNDKLRIVVAVLRLAMFTATRWRNRIFWKSASLAR